MALESQNFDLSKLNGLHVKKSFLYQLLRKGYKKDDALSLKNHFVNNGLGKTITVYEIKNIVCKLGAQIQYLP